METQLNKIKKYSYDDLQKYYNTENLETLHNMKLYADDIYYNTGNQDILTDDQYDMLKETLQKRDPKYVVPVGARIREHQNRVKLPFWLGSMNKFKPQDSVQIDKWINKNTASQYILEEKLDGVSCLLIYKKGKLKLYTRGEADVGADISYLSQYINSIPKLSIDINVRGELIMKKKVFVEKYSEEYVNARNMVSGRINAKTVKEGISDIDFVAYEMIDKGTMISPNEQLKYLEKLGFLTVKYQIIQGHITIIILESILHKLLNESLYQIDGIIVQPNIEYTRNTTGNPKYAFAFKIRSESNIKQTTVLSVEWNPSQWQILKPRVQIKPVKLMDVTINWTTGFNAKYIYDNSIGPGAIINITRSGDVIPYIVDVVKPAEYPDMPEGEYKWNESGVDIISEEYGDEACIKLIANFFKNLGIKQLGYNNIKRIYDSGYDSLLKIISMSEKQIAEVPGYGDKSAKRAYENIHNNLINLKIPLVLGSSGIFGFGMGVKKITLLFNNIPDILDIYKNTDKNILEKLLLDIEGFSEKSVEKILLNLGAADKFISKFSNYATFINEKNTSNNFNDNMKDITVVFTGFRDKELEEKIVMRGGRVSTSVSKNTKILVMLDTEGKRTGKVEDAIKKGVIVMNKVDFISTYIK